MKKLVSFLLLVALVCSLCAFAPSAAALSEEEEALYTKYADLIALLEAEDFSGALDTITSMMPATEYEEIALTAENFYDYFEIVTEDPNIEKNSDGSIKQIYPGSLILKMKEDIVNRVDWENSILTVGITAKKDLYRAKIDWETGEITLGDESDSDVKKAVKKLDWFEPKVDVQVSELAYMRWLSGDGFWFKHPTYKGWSSGFAEPGSKTKYYQVVYRDIELVSVEGTLFLAN